MDREDGAVRRVPAARRRADVALCDSSDAARTVQGGDRRARRSAAARRRRPDGSVPCRRAVAPGIFGVDVKPAHAGKRELIITLRATGRARRAPRRRRRCARRSRGGRAPPRPAGDEDAPGISFLKEQQWSARFRHRRRAGAGAPRVDARAGADRGRPGGEADVVAPIDGRLPRVVDSPLGARVTRGQELARILPPPRFPAICRSWSGPSGGAVRARTRRRAIASAPSADAPAPRRRSGSTKRAPPRRRHERGSPPPRRSLAQFNAARAGGADGRRGLFVIRAPVSGVIAQRDAATGTNVARRHRAVPYRRSVAGPGRRPGAGGGRGTRAACVERRRSKSRAAGSLPAGRLRERRQGARSAVADAADHVRASTIACSVCPSASRCSCICCWTTTRAAPGRPRVGNRGRCRAADCVRAGRRRDVRASCRSHSAPRTATRAGHRA